MTKIQVCLTLDKHLKESIDLYRDKQEFPVNMSTFVEIACDHYLRIRCGLPYIAKRKE